VAAITVLVEVAGASHLAGLRPRAWAPAAALAALLAAGLVWLFAAALGPAYPEVALLRGPWRAPVATFVFGLFALTDARRVHTRVEGAER
ncbi:hypothetical protein L6R52_39590, partial [Myxococcota bacterium]|nr:hypothetical protein [Myxococcota bacterium]